MIRETINIGLHSFICDFYDKKELSKSYKSKFVMLRPTVYKNSSITVPEIFILEKSILIKDIASHI